MLLSTGEQISVALCAMALESMGLPVRVSGGVAGRHSVPPRCTPMPASRRLTRSGCGRSWISTASCWLRASRASIAWGTSPRWAAAAVDTSAVALAAAFRADLCQIYTDVDGVYTTDPRIVPNAKKLDEITYDEMLELASQGARCAP